MLKQNETVTLWSYCNTALIETAKKYILWVRLRVRVWIYRFTSRWYFLSVWENQSLLNVNYLSGQMGLIFICDIFFFLLLCCTLFSRGQITQWTLSKKTQPNQKRQSTVTGLHFPPADETLCFLGSLCSKTLSSIRTPSGVTGWWRQHRWPRSLLSQFWQRIKFIF